MLTGRARAWAVDRLAERGRRQVWVPELIFGHLLTSSNYNDQEKKVVGGRNGYGAKLCNIFSTEFIVETCTSPGRASPALRVASDGIGRPPCLILPFPLPTRRTAPPPLPPTNQPFPADSRSGRRFRQVFSKNMSEKGEPRLSPAAKEDFTQITFKPDLAKFGMAQIDDDFEALVRKRVHDMAGCCQGVKVRRLLRRRRAFTDRRRARAHHRSVCARASVGSHPGPLQRGAHQGEKFQRLRRFVLELPPDADPRALDPRGATEGAHAHRSSAPAHRAPCADVLPCWARGPI